MCKRFRDVLLEPSAVWEASGLRARRRQHPRCFVALLWAARVRCLRATSNPTRLPSTPTSTQTLHVDFLQKGLDLALPAQQPGDGGDAGDGSNRRLLHTALERWLKPRAASVKRLVLS